MHPSCLRSALAALALAALSPAQNTIVVDAAAGGDFTDIPPAVAAAGDGDVILVRAGTYSLFTVDGKALAIVGAAGVQVGDAGTLGSVTVSNLPAGRDLVLADLDCCRARSPVPTAASRSSIATCRARVRSTRR